MKFQSKYEAFILENVFDNVLCKIVLIIFCCIFVAVNESHTFYNATTIVPTPSADGTIRKIKTKMLNQTVHPEEKRKIIGDTFMNVANELVEELNLKPEDVYLGQGQLCCMFI